MQYFLPPSSHKAGDFPHFAQPSPFGAAFCPESSFCAGGFHSLSLGIVFLPEPPEEPDSPDLPESPEAPEFPDPESP